MARFLRGNMYFGVLLVPGSDLVQGQRVGLFGKLPNGSHCAHREQGVEGDFQNVSAFLFRLNQKSVGRSIFHIFFLCCEDAADRGFCLSELSVIIGLRILDEKSP
jgi:hypothetical protein